MVVAADIPIDLSYSGSFNKLISPPAIQQTLTEGEMLKRARLYQGSGGTVASLISTDASGTSTSTGLAPQSRLTDIVNTICTSFVVTKEELANLCNIQSRKTLYNWMSGETKPRKDSMNRIYDLFITAKAWNDAGFSIHREQLFQAVVDGQSIFDLLSQPVIDTERILFTGSRLSLLTPVTGALPDPFA